MKKISMINKFDMQLCRANFIH